jgi:mono/diheme cytochrome c family protein
VRALLLTLPVAAALGVTACGTQGIDVPEDDPARTGAVLFAERCSGCHTLSAAGTEGSGNNSLRNQGPNFDQRKVSFDDALYAIQNGGFSGAIMPQNILVGDDAKAVAQFLDEYSGQEATPALTPGSGSTEQSGGSEGGQ